MARKPEGPPPAPAVQKLRMRYAKRGRLRFSSHRDFQRAFERALRRAAVPMAYSAGFSPHPKVSYAGAAPTGVASEAEYVEVSVTERVDPERLRAALDVSLPDGLDAIEIVESSGGALADRLQASLWEIRLPGVDPARAEHAVAAFLAAESVEVQRLTKNGVRTFDARAAVVRADVMSSDGAGSDGAGSDGAGSDGAGSNAASSAWADMPERRDAAAAAEGGSYAILRLVVRHVTPVVRPDDVLSGLRRVADLAPPSPPSVTRLAQGPLVEAEGAVADPLTPDRDAVGAGERSPVPDAAGLATQPRTSVAPSGDDGYND